MDLWQKDDPELIYLSQWAHDLTRAYPDHDTSRDARTLVDGRKVLHLVRTKAARFKPIVTQEHSRTFRELHELILSLEQIPEVVSWATILEVMES